MKTAVRYYSKSGNTRKIALAIAEAAGVKAETTDEALSEPVDLLFLGGAVYAKNIDSRLQSFVKQLSSEKVKSVAVFSTSAGGRSIQPQIEELLKGKGITTAGEGFACKGKFLFVNRDRPNGQDCDAAAAFAKKLLNQQHESTTSP
jgi:flavodoxin